MTAEEFNLQNTNDPGTSGEEKHSSYLSELLVEFASYTTLHGLHFIFDSFAVVRRLLWAVLLCSGVAFLVWQCYQGYQKFQSKDSITVKEQTHEEQIVFPAVTFCNQNMLRKEKIMGTKAQAFLDDIESITFGDALKNTSDDIFTVDLDAVVRDAGHNISGMLVNCTWGGKPCGPDDFYLITSLKRGLCYTFNSGKPGYPLRHQKAGGRTQGLVVQLNAQPDQYYGPFNLHDGTGFRVLVHDQWDSPDMEDYGMDVSPGFSTSIGVQRQKFIHLPPPYKSKCGERKLSGFKEYSQSACELECWTRLITTKCQCRTLGMARLEQQNTTHFCGARDFVDCVLPTSGTFSVGVDCDCPIQCTEVHYDVALSSASFPSRHILPIFMRRRNVSEANMTKELINTVEYELRRRLLQLNIFYQNTVTEVLQEKPAYGIFDFGSDIGGNMGLFLGCSLLTIFEFLDLLILLCWGSCARHRKVYSPN